MNVRQAYSEKKNHFIESRHLKVKWFTFSSCLIPLEIQFIASANQHDECEGIGSFEYLTESAKRVELSFPEGIQVHSWFLHKRTNNS